MFKLKQIIGRLVLRWLGVNQPFDTKWKPGYIRYFTVLSYPKEGWINTFHNYDDGEQLERDLTNVFVDSFWGSMIKKDAPQIVLRPKKKNVNTKTT